MIENDGVPCFNWMILQAGQLPLRPDGRLVHTAEHRCTAVLIWPHGVHPAVDNTILIDPCFTDTGIEEAHAKLDRLDIALDDVGRIFITHLHGDHMLHLPYDVPAPRFRPLRPDTRIDGIELVLCPGHHPLLLALTFRAADGRAIWVVGDAVLDEEWLRAWHYFWVNGYTPDEIAETWRSVAAIVARADLIIPGHGAPITVDAELVGHLLETFPQAAFADRCPSVIPTLRTRWLQLSEQVESGE